MSWKTLKPTSPKTGIDKKFISFSGGKVNFSSEFLYQNKLQDINYVMIFLDEETFKLGFRFFKEKDNGESVKLNWKNGVAKSARIGDESLRKISFVLDIINRQDPSERRFVPKLESVDGARSWVISLIPEFNHQVSRGDLQEVPAEARGVYRYLSDGKIVYIGKGSIRRRAQEAQRSEWKFDTIEYVTISVSDANSASNEQLKWEKYFIRKFKNENNNERPFYNRNDGVSTE